MFAIVRAGVV